MSLLTRTVRNIRDIAKDLEWFAQGLEDFGSDYQTTQRAAAITHAMAQATADVARLEIQSDHI